MNKHLLNQLTDEYFKIENLSDCNFFLKMEQESYEKHKF